MQLVSTSIHAADIYARDSERAELARYVDRFLENNEVTVLETRTAPPPNRPIFNLTISKTASRQKAADLSSETIAAEVRALAAIDMFDGVRMKRRASEVAKIMRARGYKLSAQSVIRIASRIGVELAA